MDKKHKYLALIIVLLVFLTTTLSPLFVNTTKADETGESAKFGKVIITMYKQKGLENVSTYVEFVSTKENESGYANVPKTVMFYDISGSTENIELPVGRYLITSDVVNDNLDKYGGSCDYYYIDVTEGCSININCYVGDFEYSKVFEYEGEDGAYKESEKHPDDVNSNGGYATINSPLSKDYNARMEDTVELTGSSQDDINAKLGEETTTEETTEQETTIENKEISDFEDTNEKENEINKSNKDKIKASAIKKYGLIVFIIFIFIILILLGYGFYKERIAKDQLIDPSDFPNSHDDDDESN